ncbi:hypothetical protein ACXGQW_05705 [Wenyingzhuangia sp. IMCC45533]
MKKHHLILAGFFAVIFSFSTLAQEQKLIKDLESLYKTLDKNADEMLTFEELGEDAELSEVFEEADVDEDGSLNFEEFKLFMESDLTQKIWNHAKETKKPSSKLEADKGEF